MNWNNNAHQDHGNQADGGVFTIRTENLASDPGVIADEVRAEELSADGLIALQLTLLKMPYRSRRAWAMQS